MSNAKQKQVNIQPRFDAMLSEISKKRRRQNELVHTKGGIVGELIMAQYKKEMCEGKKRPGKEPGNDKDTKE